MRTKRTWRKCGHPRTKATTCKVSLRQAHGQCRICTLGRLARYNKSPKGRAATTRYRKSPKGRITNRRSVDRYQKTPKGRATHSRSDARYRTTGNYVISDAKSNLKRLTKRYIQLGGKLEWLDEK